MICPTCAGPLTPFGHGYLECPSGEGCDAVFTVEAGKLIDCSFCQPEVIDIPVAILAPAALRLQCPECRTEFGDGDLIFTTINGRTVHRSCFYRQPWPSDEALTVKRATLFDGVVDSYATETELNGHRATQGRMF